MNNGDKRLKIVLMGINDIGEKVRQYLHELQQDEIHLIVAKDELNKVKQLKPDIILSVGFRQIIPEDILDIPPLGAINFHKSLLPLHRGANPVFWTILNETRAGVTIHYMDKGIDTGKIIAQMETEVAIHDTAETLYRRLESMQLELFKKVWQKIRKGSVSASDQSGESSYHVIEDFKQLRKISSQRKMNVMKFIHFLRAMTFPPFDNAYIEHNGKKYFIEIKIKEEGLSPDHNKKKTVLNQYEFKDA